MKAGAHGYEYNPDFMREAFALYCNGVSGTQIVVRMQKEWPNVCRQTVCRIINKHGWEKARAKFIELQRDGVGEREKAIEVLLKTQERLEELVPNSENHQHFAQLMRCIELRAKLMGWMDVGEDGIVMSNDLEMNAYLDALEEVLGDALTKAKRQIKRVYEEKMKGTKGTKETKGTE
jgi:predicted nucleotidyltransferase